MYGQSELTFMIVEDLSKQTNLFVSLPKLHCYTYVVDPEASSYEPDDETLCGGSAMHWQGS
jgi:hypothetical protein